MLIMWRLVEKLSVYVIKEGEKLQTVDYESQEIFTYEKSRHNIKADITG